MVTRLRTAVPAPAVAVAPFGLVNSRTIVLDADKDEHWVGGMEVDSELGTAGLNIRDSSMPCDPPGTDPPKNQIILADPLSAVDRHHPYNPFVVQAVDSCMILGTTFNERRLRVLRQLKANISYAAEVEFWYGDLARLQETGGDTLNRYLTTDAQLINPPANNPWGPAVLVDVTPASAPAGVPPVIGMGLMEDAANAVFHDVAFVHVPRFLLPILADNIIAPHQVKKTSEAYFVSDPVPEPGEEAHGSSPDRIPHAVPQQDILRTYNGNYVIAGYGYSRNYYAAFSPAGPTMGPWNGGAHADGIWMYATGPVAVRIGEPMVIPEIPAMAYTERNESTLRAEAPVSVVWDGPHVFAVKVEV